MKKVSDILARKGAHIISIVPHATVLEALRIFTSVAEKLRCKGLNSYSQDEFLKPAWVRLVY